jgi:CxxC motif-containing protein (DUF1111 family)
MCIRRQLRIVLLTPLIAVMLIAAARLSSSPSSGISTLNESDNSVARGATLFATEFTPEQGLGPLFNKRSCISCHAEPSSGGMGPEGLATAMRIGRLTPAGFDPMIGAGGPIARAHSVAEDGLPCDLRAGIPAGANVTSVRNAPNLHGIGLISEIADEEIAAGAIKRPGGVHGRAHSVLAADGRKRIGRIGWKADTASLTEFVANAFRNELGITSPLAPVDLTAASQAGRTRCPGEGASIEDDGSVVDAVTAFLEALSPPVATRPASLSGAALFSTVGCDACHTPSLPLRNMQVRLYSDLLLHDLGPDLDDGVVQGDARGRDWRTTPLWGLGIRSRLLHDGRARTITEAILIHGGEAEQAKQHYKLLSPKERQALLAFLGGL